MHISFTALCEKQSIPIRVNCAPSSNVTASIPLPWKHLLPKDSTARGCKSI
jgi:hypothetical protein